MKLIDRQYLATPFYGVRKIAAWLKSQGYRVNRKRARRLMRIGEAFTGLLRQRGVKSSMDGKGHYSDNLFIERLWRTVKYEKVYLKAYQDGRDARAGIGDYFRFYNTERPHQALGYRTPAEVLNSTPVESNYGDMIESLTPNPLRIAGPNLNIAPILS